jgi:hypothetical protein
VFDPPFEQLDPQMKAKLAQMVALVKHDAGGGKKHSHHEEEPTFSFFGEVKARFQWGEEPPEQHADFESLFLDLIYVGVAFNLGVLLKESFYACLNPDGSSASGSTSSGSSSSASGSLSSASDSLSSASDSLSSASGSLSSASGSVQGRMLSSAEALHECDGLAEGYLHMFVFFLVLFNQWVIDVWWDATVQASGLFHRIMEFTFLASLAASATAIKDTHLLKQNGAFWWWFHFFNMISLGTWALQYLRVALSAKAANVRRQGAEHVLTLVAQMCVFTVAWVFASHPREDQLYYPMLIVMIVAVFVPWLLTSMIKLCIRSEGRKHGRTRRRHEQTIPINVPFFRHRVHEFFLLMVGESVLQVGGTPPTSHYQCTH